MASQEEEEAGSDKLSDEEVFSETSRKAASRSEYSSTKWRSFWRIIGSRRAGAALPSGIAFVPGEHNKMDKFLDIVVLMKENRAKALGIYCHELV